MRVANWVAAGLLVTLGAGGLAGCGSSSDGGAVSGSASTSGSGASSGSAGAAASASAAASGGAATSGGAAAPSGSATASKSVAATSGLGDLPTFLPSATGGGMATGDATHPALSYPASPVVVKLPTGTVTVDVQGPAIPAGTAVGATSVQATFTMTLSDASAPVPLDVSAMDVQDNHGGVHPVKAASTDAVPAQLAPGAKAVLHLTATVPAGEGMLRLRPGGTMLAAWDYVAETD